MEHSNNIFLVGLMGAGKTTVGRQLARRLRKRFVDCDHEIEARTGVSIPTIFEIEGEAGFRRRESAAIEALSQETGLVLATGGGAVLDPENRRNLKAGGWVVYLDVPPDILWSRTRGTPCATRSTVKWPITSLPADKAARVPLCANSNGST